MQGATLQSSQPPPLCILASPQRHSSQKYFTHTNMSQSCHKFRGERLSISFASTVTCEGFQVWRVPPRVFGFGEYPGKTRNLLSSALPLGCHGVRNLGWGLGIGVWGLRFGVCGFGSGVWGLGFGVWVLRFGIRVQGLRGSDFGIRVQGLGLRFGV